MTVIVSIDAGLHKEMMWEKKQSLDAYGISMSSLTLGIAEHAMLEESPTAIAFPKHWHQLET